VIWLGSSIGDFFALPIKTLKNPFFQGETVYRCVPPSPRFYGIFQPFGQDLVKVGSGEEKGVDGLRLER
jgi:hypothetical protein